MAWDGVPWFVGGGAEHTPETARLLSFAAFGGAEGIVGPGDLRVTARSVPDETVAVVSGACAILNRASAQDYQAYAARLPSQEVVEIAPTDSSGGRSDLIVVRVEDPYLSGEPWDEPDDEKAGPYVFTRVISNVPSSTTSLQDVEPGQSGIALARIDLPASTGTIEQSMITDLREVVLPRSKRLQRVGQGSALTLTSSSWTAFPSSSGWEIEVPEWATHAILRGDAAGVRFRDNITGDFRVRLGSQVGSTAPFDVETSGTGEDRSVFMAVAEVSIPESMRGSRQTFTIEARRRGGASGSYLKSGGWISTIQDVEFVQRAN